MNLDFIIILAPVLLFSIIVHEVAHGYAALSYGDRTARDQNRLSFNPLYHIDFFGTLILPALTILMGFFFGYAKPVPYNPNCFFPGTNIKKAEAFIAIVGPLSNFLLAFLCSLFLKIFLFFNIGNSEILYEIFFLMIYINILLGIFNMIPIAPLDGSKILYYFLPNKYYFSVRNFLEKNQFIFLFLLIIILVNFSKYFFKPIMQISNLLV